MLDPGSSDFITGLTDFVRGGTGPNGKDSLTVAEAAVQLTRLNLTWASGPGQSASVSFAFRASAADPMPGDVGAFVRFNPAQIQLTELMLQAWSDVANISFTRVGSGTSDPTAFSDNATILFGGYASGPLGQAWWPGSRAASSHDGDVWVDQSSVENTQPLNFGFAPRNLIHEIGHAIGLSHPGDYNGTGLTYANSAGYYEDSKQYTVMTYWGENETGGDFWPTNPMAPQMDDIAAAQRLYGANMTTRTGDTVYGFNSNAGRIWYELTNASDRIVFCVWDAGGTDTLDFSGYAQNQLIDLRQGAFSDVGGLKANVSIAMGADVENARGGSGSDIINGNGLANAISGGAGTDTLSGGNGANYLRGDDGADLITGGADFDDINGNQGNDTASGGGGDDWVVGGKDQDSLSGEAGADIVYGNLGNDTGDGGSGDDIIRGGQGDDVLFGGTGDDWISGDRGNDTVTGGAGADTFNSFAEAGQDRILDFNRTEGDRVRLDPGSTYTVNQVGADTVVNVTGGAKLILVGIQFTSLTGDWIFVG